MPLPSAERKDAAMKSLDRAHRETLSEMLDRAYFDVQNYYLSDIAREAHRENYADQLEVMASECLTMAGCLYVLGYSEAKRLRWVRLATHLRKLAAREQRERIQ